MYDENIMKLVLDISKSSKDPSARVAAVITNQDNEVLSVGVNRLKPYILVDELDYIYKNKNVKKYAYDHAEMVALMNLTPTDEELNIYINYPSCLQCTAEMLLNVNYKFKNIFYVNTGSDSFKKRYQTDDALQLMLHRKVNAVPIDLGE